jgi:flagellar hook-associated protein 2
MSVASTSALSALLSSLNNGSSGLNVSAAVSAVITADAAPEGVWESDQSTLSSEAAEIQQIEGEAANLTSSLQALSDPAGALYSMTATSSNPAAVSASAASGATAAQHNVYVSSLASESSWYSEQESSASAALPSGSFTLTLASGASQTFTTGSGGSDDLSDMASAINGAGLGVTASVVNDVNGSRLAIVSNSSGSQSAFSVGSASGMSFQEAQAGADASITIDGVPVSSATNTFADAIPGVTMTVAQQGAATVNLSPDTASIDTAVSSFVSDYNTLVTELKNQFTFNSSTNAEGVLGTDSVARSMQNDVLAASNLNIGTGDYQTLASLGISTSDDGTLTMNTGALNSALSSDFNGVVSFFQGSGSGSTAVSGFASSVISTLSTYTDPVQGAFTIDLSSLSSENQDLQDQINTFNIYLLSEQSLLTTEYNKANIALQQLPQTIKNTDALLGENSSGGNGN